MPLPVVHVRCHAVCDPCGGARSDVVDVTLHAPTLGELGRLAALVGTTAAGCAGCGEGVVVEEVEVVHALPGLPALTVGADGRVRLDGQRLVHDGELPWGVVELVAA